MQVQFKYHIPIAVDDNTFIEVYMVDGVEYTGLYKKVSEPNLFNEVKRENGDTSATIAQIE